jgi:transcriptional regulator with XRE-family HTH domain
LTLVELADRCAAEGAAVHHSQLSKIERGIHPPRPHLRVVLARILDMKPDAFESNEPATPEVTG